MASKKTYLFAYSRGQYMSKMIHTGLIVETSEKKVREFLNKLLPDSGGKIHAVVHLPDVEPDSV